MTDRQKPHFSKEKRVFLFLFKCFLLSIALVSCARNPTYETIRTRYCPNKTELWDSVDDCKYLARQGDIKAAVILGKFYDGFGRDPKAADEWYTVAAEAGDPDSQYHIGMHFKQNSPEKAAEWFAKAAMQGKYCAQAELSSLYYDGSGGLQTNWAQAFFWANVAANENNNLKFEISRCLGKTRTNREVTDCYAKYNKAWDDKSQCQRLYPIKTKLEMMEKHLPENLKVAVKNTVTKWNPEMEVPVFPVPEIPQVTASAATDSKSATPPLSSPPKTTRKAPGEEPQKTPRVLKPSPSTEKSPESQPKLEPPLAAKAKPGGDRRQSFIWPSWKKLDASLRATPKNQPLEPDKLFSSVSGSVWVVITKTMEAGNKPDEGITLGSAVAVSKKLLVTNCHVLKNNRSIRLLQGKENIEASIFAADEEGDRCILSVTKDLPSVASGFRDFSDLKVGEKVYSIGSPSGLEKTLGEGLISGLRPLKSSRLVQTTAPISAGSSGGGLFDSAGNLIGVTTFLLRDAQNLNFAIAVSDFWRE